MPYLFFTFPANTNALSAKVVWHRAEELSKRPRFSSLLYRCFSEWFWGKQFHSSLQFPQLKSMVPIRATSALVFTVQGSVLVSLLPGLGQMCTISACRYWRHPKTPAVVCLSLFREFKTPCKSLSENAHKGSWKSELSFDNKFSSRFICSQFWEVTLLKTTVTHNKMWVYLFLFGQKENIQTPNILVRPGKSCQLHWLCISLACSLGWAASFGFSWFVADETFSPSLFMLWRFRGTVILGVTGKHKSHTPFSFW